MKKIFFLLLMCISPSFKIICADRGNHGSLSQLIFPLIVGITLGALNTNYENSYKKSVLRPTKKQQALHELYGNQIRVLVNTKNGVTKAIELTGGSSGFISGAKIIMPEQKTLNPQTALITQEVLKITLEKENDLEKEIIQAPKNSLEECFDFGLPAATGFYATKLMCTYGFSIPSILIGLAGGLLYAASQETDDSKTGFETTYLRTKNATLGFSGVILASSISDGSLGNGAKRSFEWILSKSRPISIKINNANFTPGNIYEMQCATTGINEG